MLPSAFEFDAIRFDWTRLRAELLAHNIHDWRVRPHRSLLTPKARYGFRTITQLDPLDFLVYASLVFEIGPAIEARRVPVADNVVFSYRYKPDASGQLFDPSVDYAQFHKRSSDLMEQGFDYVAVTDISDFYQRIYLHRLEGSLSAANVDAKVSRA